MNDVVALAVAVIVLGKSSFEPVEVVMVVRVVVQHVIDVIKRVQIPLRISAVRLIELLLLLSAPA
jgi:hypothetical protein